MQIAKSYKFNWDIYVDTLPHLPEIYKSLTVQYTDQFTLKWDISELKDKKKLPISYKNYFDAKIELLNFKWKVWIGTGVWRNDFFIYK